MSLLDQFPLVHCCDLVVANVVEGEPHENQHIEKHEAGEEEELVGLRFKELELGDDHDDDIAEGNGQQPTGL